MSRIEWLTHGHFAGRIGERFAVALPEGEALELQLVEATESDQLGGPGPEGQERRQFSLVFRGPVSPALTQQIYRLDHEELGELELFLVPISLEADGMRYEAVFA